MKNNILNYGIIMILIILYFTAGLIITGCSSKTDDSIIGFHVRLQQEAILEVCDLGVNFEVKTMEFSFAFEVSNDSFVVILMIDSDDAFHLPRYFLKGDDAWLWFTLHEDEARVSLNLLILEYAERIVFTNISLETFNSIMSEITNISVFDRASWTFPQPNPINDFWQMERLRSDIVHG